jgi:hypothetical protein
VADGCYTIKAKVITDLGDENTDSVNITVGTGCGGGNTPYLGTPFVLPTRIEAEYYDLGGEGVAYHDADGGNNGNQYGNDFRTNEDVDTEACTDTGGGYNVGWMAANEWLEYVVTVPAAGTYEIDIRVASNATGGNFHIEFNGIDVTGNLSVPVTGGWQNWTTVSATATLTAGTQIMRFVNADSADEYNINYFDITAPMATVPDVVGLSQISGHSAIIAQGLTLGTTTYTYSDIVGINIIMTQSPGGGTSVIAGSAVNTEISLGLRGDLDNNDSVDIEDVRIMAAEWLTAGTQADIAPIAGPGDGGDGRVDLTDFAVLASDWLESN